MDHTVNMKGKVQEPKEGMLFNTIDEVKEYYRRYGNELGFSVRNRTSKKGGDGEFIYVTFACSRAGKASSISRNIRKRLPSARTECKAKLSVAICVDGKWQVTLFKHDHNHALSPGAFVERDVESNNRAGFTVNKNVDSCVVDGGGYENVPNLGKDFRNYTDKVTRLPLGQGDASAIQNYFMKMQADNSNFFYTMDLDDEGCLRNVFWADARSRKAYEEFGDVITFETTYLTNKYDMPLVAFVGVNQHGQSTLFGCGLLSGEDTETFTWLFQSWLACMFGCAPKAIVIDHDKAIQKAIETLFPNTHHRWCLWHIMRNLPEKLRGCKQDEAIIYLLQNVVYGSLTLDEFEVRWNRMIEKFNLQSNEWLLGLYDERHRWVPVFLKDTFWAGMSTTQQSAFFDGYVNSKTTLKQFLQQYENALQSMVEREKHEDFNSLNSQVPCVTHYAMEKQFQDAYTSTKFKEFQHELTGKICCELSSVKKDVTMSEYEISEDLKVGEIDRRATFNVSLTHDDCDIHCTCCLFESRGILCRHAIIVLIHIKILRVPDKYICPRWRKDLKRRHTKVKISYADSSCKPEAGRFDKMSNAFLEVADLAADFEDKTKMVMDWINEMKKELKRDEGICRSSQPTMTLNNGRTSSSSDVIPISAPPLKRKQSKVVNSVKKTREKKKRRERKNTTSCNTMQESKKTEDVGVGIVDGGSNGAPPTMHFANANLFMWGVPQNGQPTTSSGASFAPPMVAYAPGYAMNNAMHPMFPQGAILVPRDFATSSARKSTRKLRRNVPRHSNQRAPVIPFWRSTCGMDMVSNSIGMIGINVVAPPSNVPQPTMNSLEGVGRPHTGT